MKEVKIERAKIYKLCFQFDDETVDHLNRLANMFPYSAPKAVVVRELINSAYGQAVKDGLIVE